MDEWFEYLYVNGVLNQEYAMGNPVLKALVYEYNHRFSDCPLNEEFFFNNTRDEQIKLLSDAIENNEPIKARRK